MLRLDLLRDLPPSDLSAARAKASADDGGGVPGAAPSRRGPLRPILLTLLALLVLGAVSLTLVAPPGFDLRGGLAGLWVRDGQARADSLREAGLRALRADASARIAASQSHAIEWLYQLEAMLPAPDAKRARLTRASFTVPGRFMLRGEAASPEALSAIQEALVLVPGLDLVESISGDDESAPGFSFAGTIDFPTDDSAPGAERIADARRLPEHLDRLERAGRAAGVTLSAPRAGDVLASGALRLHVFRIAGSLQTPDSSGFAPVREFLETARHDGSPLGIQRITLENRAGRRLVFLDIMTFTP